MTATREALRETVTIALTAAEAEAAYRAAAYAWDVYRRFQQVPFPKQGGGDLMGAQSRLWHAAAPYACGQADIRDADILAIGLATADLIAAAGKHCGPAAAAFVSGDPS